MDVHVGHPRFIPEEVVVQRRDLQAVVEQRRHHGIDFVLQQHQVTHHHVHAAPLGHRDPSAKPERRRGCDVRDGHRDVVARNVDFENVVLEIPRLPQKREHFLVLRRHFLGG
jgi:hypothetical protein